VHEDALHACRRDIFSVKLRNNAGDPIHLSRLELSRLAAYPSTTGIRVNFNFPEGRSMEIHCQAKWPAWTDLRSSF
jgi:hypothetical protein